MVVGNVRARLASYIQITRITNSIYAAVYTLVGAYLAAGPLALAEPASWVAAAVVALVVAYGFVINDYVDVTVDAYSKPGRPLPAGALARRDALVFGLALAGLALALATTLGPAMAGFALGTVILAAYYSLALKSTVLWGNACMGLLIGSIAVFGALSTGAVPARVWAVAALIWLFDLSHEILKTTADHAGDGQASLATVATVFGVPAALRIFQLTALLFCAAALLPWLGGLAPASYLWLVLPCAILPTLLVIAMLARDGSDPTIASALKIMRYMWISNLLPILAIGADSISKATG